MAKLGFRELDSDENDEETAENEPNENEGGKGAGSTISTPILELPQNLAFAENNQRL